MKRRILVGTTNPSKVEWLSGYLTEIPNVECVTLKDLGVTVDVPEEGSTPEENALLKALAYHKATGLAVIGHDSGLYFQEFPMDSPLQPGLYIRRVDGRVLDDDGMMEYYANFARKYGPLHGCYCSGFAAVDEDGYYSTFAQDSVENQRYVAEFGFLMCAEPHPKRHPGWPLDSLCKDIRTGEYWFDQEEHSVPESDFGRSYRQNVNHFFENFFGK